MGVKFTPVPFLVLSGNFQPEIAVPYFSADLPVLQI